jgi:hypothetical protein
MELDKFKIQNMTGFGIILGNIETGKTTLINEIIKYNKSIEVYDNIPIEKHHKNFIVSTTNLKNINYNYLFNVDFIFLFKTTNKQLSELYQILSNMIYPDCHKLNFNVLCEYYNKYTYNYQCLVIDINKLTSGMEYIYWYIVS